MDESPRILITGANGFVGRHLICALLNSEELGKAKIFAGVHSVDAALVHVPDLAGWDGQDVEGGIESIALDLTDDAALQATVQSVQPTHIVHLAGRASGASVDRDAVFEVNVTGTRRLLEAASEITPFPRTLAISTGYVYGNTETERPAREEDPVGPLWKYGAYTDSKIEMESVARAYAAFVQIVRPFAHIGPGQSPSFALSSFARQLVQIEKGQKPPVIEVGNLEATRDMLDVRDVVDGYVKLLVHGVSGEVTNIATGKPFSMQNALDRLIDLSKATPELHVDPERLRPADISCSTGDSFHLRSITDWKPRYTVDQTLTDLLEYWRQALN